MKIASKVCDNSLCAESLQLEPALYGGLPQRRWMHLSAAVAELDFCSLECLQMWVEQKIDKRDKAKKGRKR